MSKIQFLSDEGRKIGRRGPNIPSFKLRITIILKPIILLLFDLNMDRNYKYLFLHIFFIRLCVPSTIVFFKFIRSIKKYTLQIVVFYIFVKNFVANCACCTLKKRIKKVLDGIFSCSFFFFNTHFLSFLETHMHTYLHISLSFSLSLYSCVIAFRSI